MKEYTTKPFKIVAEQWNGGPHPAITVESNVALVAGAQGAVQIYPSDYIIVGPQGNGFYPCAASVFEKKYEAVND